MSKFLTNEQFAKKFVDKLIETQRNHNVLRYRMKHYDLGLAIITNYLDSVRGEFREQFENMIVHALPTDETRERYSVPDETLEWFGPIHHSNFRQIDVFDLPHLDSTFHECIGNSELYWDVVKMMCQWYDTGKVDAHFLDDF